MKLLLSAFIGSENLGDEAIASVLIPMLERVEGVDLVVATLDKDRTRPFASTRMTRFVAAGYRSVAREARKVDALILGGGGIIQDESSVLNMIRYVAQAWAARRRGAKVYLLFVGVGPVRTRVGRMLLRRLARIIDHSVVRDEASRALLVAHGFEDDAITVTYDLVFSMGSRAPRGGTTTSGADDYVLFCPRDWFFSHSLLPAKWSRRLARHRPGSSMMRLRHRYLSFVEAALRADAGLTLKAVPFYPAQDAELLQWIYDRLPGSVRARFVVRADEVGVVEYLDMAAGARAVVGVRLHAMVLAAVAGARILPMAYSTKVVGMADYLGAGADTVIIDSPDFSFDSTLAGLAQSGRPRPTLSRARLEQIRVANRDAFDAFVARTAEQVNRG